MRYTAIKAIRRKFGGLLCQWGRATLLILLLGTITKVFAAEGEQDAASQPQAKNSDKASSKPTAKNNKPKAIEETVLGMNVTGNKELPNMLYIVPWKAKQPPLSEPSVQPLVNEVFSTLDPDVFKRESEFYYQLTESERKTNSNKK